MANKRPLVIVLVLLGVVYCLVGALVVMRTIWWAPPQLAASAYLKAVMNRDTTGIYMYSDMLGPHLAGMMAKSKMGHDARRHMWAKDFTRWKTEFEKGSKAQDSLKRERRLLHGQVVVEPIAGGQFKAEVKRGEVIDLETYTDDPGQTHHFYYRLSYPALDGAPKVSILDNVLTGRNRHIRSVVVRVEVRRRPDVEPPQSWLLSWDWLDTISVAFPFRHLFTQASPEEVWMAMVSFAIDKMQLETY
jgi:hypothetical protein